MDSFDFEFHIAAFSEIWLTVNTYDPEIIVQDFKFMEVIVK